MKKHLRITVNGKTYEVLAEILDDNGNAAPAAAGPARVAGSAAVLAAAPPPRAAPSSAPAAPLPGELRSPLAGKVVAIDAAPGTAVTAGQTVLTLEAMKMNTLIAATGPGTVTAVHVKPGDAVEEGQLLMTIG
ncbi:MAG: acetyl-CoA carboxylase biotin carboxyl carrier protein subunit [Polaromonas sp.]|nr:acetyl-CoA carboxylase biotin carboxyl carrier protein subunit [Polaromonas sp.]